MIDVDIVTPSRKILVGAKVDKITLPTASGEVTVLPGHTELVTLLSTGVLSLPTTEKERIFAVSYGFSLVHKDKVIVLAETCEEADEIDVARAKLAQKKAEDALASAKSESETKKFQLKLERALIRQRVGA
jgi:F-type H+-transporting ATPase subunit epsilon